MVPFRCDIERADQADALAREIVDYLRNSELVDTRHAPPEAFITSVDPAESDRGEAFLRGEAHAICRGSTPLEWARARHRLIIGVCSIVYCA